MKNQKTFTTRRGEYRGSSAKSGYGFSHYEGISNFRRSQKPMGGVMQGAIVGLLVLVVGLIYVSQGAQASGLDYQISKIDGEISELTAEKEDLEIEKARLTSVATINASEVAANMQDASAENR